MLLVTYALELLIWPTIVTNKVVKLLRSGSLTPKKLRQRGQERNSTKSKGERLENCLGGCLKCISVLCCNKTGGKDLKNQGELRDFASNLMEFANNDSKVDVVLSDMYVGLKMLARVQAERRMMAIQNIQKASNKKKDDTTHDAALEEQAVMDRRLLLPSTPRRSILTLQAKADGDGFAAVDKDVLSSSNEGDVDLLRKAAHFSVYAMYIYFHIRDAAVIDFGLEEDSTVFLRDIETMFNDLHSLSSVGREQTHLMYANFFNGLSQTPYAILVDDAEQSVVITVRGTKSLEDWVADLTYVPQPLDKVGKICGYGSELDGHHCHKGVLTRCKWIYNDIKK